MKILLSIVIVLLIVIAGALIYPQMDHRSDLEIANDNLAKTVKETNDMLRR